MGTPVAREAGDVTLPNFEAQCDVLLETGPAAVSSMMGLFPDRYVARMKDKGIKWFATVTTLSEAKTAEQAGADVMIAQGMEAGGHRGAFDVTQAEARMVGLLSLLPAVADAVKVPVVAAGGIADGRGMAAALLLGASAVQVGTALLRSPEAKIPPPGQTRSVRPLRKTRSRGSLQRRPGARPCDRLCARGDVVVLKNPSRIR